MQYTQLHATIQDQSKQIAELTAKIDNLSGKVPPPPPKPLATPDLESAAIAVFGDRMIQQVKQDHVKNEAEFHDRLEKIFYFSHLDPGYSLAHLEARVGPPKPLFGLRRIENLAQKAALQNHFSKLK